MMGATIECACDDCVKRKAKGLDVFGQVELIENIYERNIVKLQIQQVSLKAIEEANERKEKYICFDQSTHVALDANGLVELIRGAKEALKGLTELEESK